MLSCPDFMVVLATLIQAIILMQHKLSHKYDKRKTYSKNKPRHYSHSKIIAFRHLRPPSWKIRAIPNILRLYSFCIKTALPIVLKIIICFTFEDHIWEPLILPGRPSGKRGDWKDRLEACNEWHLLELYVFFLLVKRSF